MKKLNLFILVVTLMSNLSFAFGQNELDAESKISIDTIYYNSEWKSVSSKFVADYYRVVVKSLKKEECRFRGYTIIGELITECGYIYLDAEDDSKSIFNGRCTDYYKNGKVSQKKVYIDGKLHGECIVYNENGLIKQHGNFNMGEIDGIYTEFNDDGLCIQAQFHNGEPDKYYTVSNDKGCVMKFDAATNTPIWESPEAGEKQANYRDGVAWPYYNKNGVVVSMANTMVKDYGKYYQIQLVIANNSLVPIDFDPTVAITATATTKAGIVKDISVLSSDEYLRKVKRSQNWTKALVGFSEGFAAANAGYSTKTTNSNTYSHGSAYASGTHGSAYGTYSGHSSTTTTTREYDAAAAYQARVIASNRVASFEASQLQERYVKEEGYLKRTTIQPTEIISGYVNIKRGPGEASMVATININGAEYIFAWNN